MDRNRAADIAQVRVEQILLAVGLKFHFAQPVRPGGEKRDAVGQDILPVDLHFGGIGHRWPQRDLYALRRIAKPDDGNTVIQGLLGLVILRDGGDGENKQQSYVFHAPSIAQVPALTIPRLLPSRSLSPS